MQIYIDSVKDEMIKRFKWAEFDRYKQPAMQKTIF